MMYCCAKAAPLSQNNITRLESPLIYRSGSVTCDYIPAFARRRLQFESDQVKQWHLLDRVGTYASFHFAKVTT